MPDDAIRQIGDLAQAMFAAYDDELAICKIEQQIHDEIMYRAAIEQARCVEPPQGWDTFGRGKLNP